MDSNKPAADGFAFPDMPGGEPLRISDQEFKDIRELVYGAFGINLTEQKRGLVVGRLQKLIRDNGFRGFTDYLAHVKGEGGQKALAELVNRISTNHTFFFREKEHFDFLANTVLPEIVAKLKASRDHDLRVWCAGCSSGEEAYTLAMLLLDFFGPECHGWKAGLLATDISTHVLDIARKGVYPPERVESLPPALRNKYLRKTPDSQWAVSDQLRQEVTFRRFNLMEKQFPFKKAFHAIFCRNVMIYFDAATRDALVERFYRFTDNGGYLVIGHSETLGRDKCRFHYVKPAIYKKI